MLNFIYQRRLTNLNSKSDNIEIHEFDSFAQIVCLFSSSMVGFSQVNDMYLSIKEKNLFGIFDCSIVHLFKKSAKILTLPFIL